MSGVNYFFRRCARRYRFGSEAPLSVVNKSRQLPTQPNGVGAGLDLLVSYSAINSDLCSHICHVRVTSRRQLAKLSSSEPLGVRNGSAVNRYKALSQHSNRGILDLRQDRCR